MSTPRSSSREADELLGDEIHPVVQAADETEIGAAIILVDLLRFVVLGLENDRGVLAVRKPFIDARRESAYALLVVVVLLDAGTGRRSDLDEGELADPFGMELHQSLHGVEALLKTLGVVEPIDAESDRVIRRKAMSLPNTRATLFDGHRDQ